MNISVIGCGYVGLVAGVCFAEFGFRVHCIDADQDKINTLNQGEVHIYENGLREVLRNNLDSGRISFHTTKSCLDDCEVVIVAVGTPEGKNGETDMTYINDALEEIAQLATNDKYIIVKSTVPMGTACSIRDSLGDVQKQRDIEFHIISNPEFLQEGSALHNFMNPDRIVVGCDSQKAQEVMSELYSPLINRGVRVVFTDNTSAELIKYASNSYLAMRIAFINEIADIAEESGANIKDISFGMGLDKRIGAGYLKPGPGYGGSCFPKDTKSLTFFARELNAPSGLIEATIKANAQRSQRMVKKILSALNGDCKEKKIAVLGLAFKANTDDMRDSPSIAIIQSLLQKQVKIQVFDPKAMQEAENIFGNTIHYCDNSTEAVTGADCLIILTEWEEFKSLDLKTLKQSMQDPVIVDLRNVLSADDIKNEGFKYFCIGKK